MSVVERIPASCAAQHDIRLCPYPTFLNFVNLFSWSPEQVAVVCDALIRHKVLVFKKIGLWIGYVQRPSFCEKVICHVSPDSRNQTILHPVRVLRVTGQFIPQSAILKVSSQH